MKSFVLALILCYLVKSSYIPEIVLTTTQEFFNKQLSVNGGPFIQQLIDNFTIPDVDYKGNLTGIPIELILTNITKKIQINWKANVINVTDPYQFTLNAKNINITVNGDLSYKILGRTIRKFQKISIGLTKLQMDFFVNFTNPVCQKSIGFNVQLAKIYTTSDKLQIKVSKVIDQQIVNLIKYFGKNKLPNIIDGTVRTMLNDQISIYTCNTITQQIAIGTQTYILQANTTRVPNFTNLHILNVYVDLNFYNERTNTSNEETKNQNLVEKHLYEKTANLTLSLSSNMVQTALWLIEDSNMFSANLTTKDLGPSPPLELSTYGLAILIPQLKKWGKKDVIVMVKFSSKDSQTFIRSGRFVSALSVSADFVVNITDKSGNITECFLRKTCQSAVKLNITLGLSAAVKFPHVNFVQGLIQSIQMVETSVLSHADGVDVDTNSLQKVLNTLIGSFRPQINKQLQEGIEVDLSKIEKLKNLNLTGVVGQSFLDFASFGALFQL